MRPLAEFPAEARAAIRTVLADIDDTLTDEGRLPASSLAGSPSPAWTGGSPLSSTTRPPETASAGAALAWTPSAAYWPWVVVWTMLYGFEAVAGPAGASSPLGLGRGDTEWAIAGGDFDMTLSPTGISPLG